MERKERLQIAYEYLRKQGEVHTQKDVASAMQATSQNVSAALKGKDGVLTEKFIRRFNHAFGDPFNINWLLYGEGEMISQTCRQEIKGDYNTQVAGNNNQVNSPATLDKAISEISEQRKMLIKSQEQIDRLIAVIEKMADARMST